MKTNWMLVVSCCAFGWMSVGCKDKPKSSEDDLVSPESIRISTKADPNAAQAQESTQEPTTVLVQKNPEPESPAQPNEVPVAVVREPTSEDPMQGKFALKDALKGLKKKGALLAVLTTSKGVIQCTLDEKNTPITTANFVGLARGERPWWDAKKAQWVKEPYYQATSFHRVIPEFMIQGGDALGDGTGGVGYVIPDEIAPSHRHDKAGQLCMANRGANTNGGQFFITDAAAPHLDGGYTIFGQCEPTSVVSQIARVAQSGAPHNRPLEPVRIEKVEITRR